MTSVRDYGIWINGTYTANEARKIFSRNAPATGEPIANFSLATVDDVEHAARVARETFDNGVWSDMPATERARKIETWIDLIEADIARLTDIEAMEAGKTRGAARGEIEWSLCLARYAASLARNIPGRLVSSEGTGNLGLVLFEPYPVVSMILPWNFPMVSLFQKLPYALAAGCSCIVKPSEFTAGTALEVAELAKQAGIPDGVINIVPGFGDEVGPPLCTLPEIGMISFTGSSRVGKIVAKLGAEHLKKVGLELGGKSANIVFADADIDAALDGALAGFTINQGEECCAGSRLLVEESIFDDFVAKLSQKAEAVRVGSFSDADAEISCMIHEAHFDRVMGYISSAVEEGAAVVCGGTTAAVEGAKQNLYVAPTILADVTSDMAVFREEVFGPVVCAIPFKDEDDAVRIANDTDYGLANGVWTNDLRRAHSVSRRLKSGSVYINTYLETVPQLPFGGMKASGIGRENGLEGLLEFMESKSVFVKLHQ
ncbi:MAG: aldehyde dehydrogenase family protein [Rhizobiaceae bacterium]